MGSNNWYKIDNVAKVFLATVGKRDTRAFRVSCTLTEDIDPELLQKAVSGSNVKWINSENVIVFLWLLNLNK